MKDIESASSSGDYGPLQYFLLDQAIPLNKTGTDFIKLSSTGGDKKGCINIALRIFRESQGTMRVVKEMRGEK